MPSVRPRSAVSTLNILCFAALALVALAAEAPADGETADYFTLSPCRIYNTRIPVHDPLRGGTDRRRDIQISGACGVPAQAVAVAVNLTAVNASRAGALTVYDADLADAPQSLSTIMLTAGRNRANNAIVGLSADGKIAAELSADFTAPADTVDLIVDVMGYFVENQPPVAVADKGTVQESSADNPIDVLANDTDPDGGMKLVTAVDTTGTIGTVAITGGGTGVLYTPAPGYCNAAPGTPLDTFGYTITGGSTSQVTMRVLCAGIQIMTVTNGEDANSAPGPSIPVGNPVFWDYLVTNTGSVGLSNFAVTDDRGVAVSCPRTSLFPGQSMRCTGNGSAQACQYSNVGTVTATRPGGQVIGAADPSHYFGTPCS